MSIMIEVYYRQPADSTREKLIVECSSSCSGELTFREDDGVASVCLTIEFPNWDSARNAVAKLTELGEYIEGPTDYGDD